MYQELQDAEWVRQKYWNEEKTLDEVAEELGCSKHTVWRAMKRLGIKRRRRTSKYSQLNEKGWLRVQYVDKGRTQADIAREVGCTVGVVRSALSARGIETRSNKKTYKKMYGNKGRTGENAAHWKGGRVMRNGYILIRKPDHPNAPKSGYVQEHRLVMEEHLGRYLEPDEIVHHIDGNKQNNAIENLRLTHNGKHISDHFKASHEVKRLRKRVAELEKELERYKRIVGEK